MSGKRHWDDVYATKGPERVSWFRPHLDRSLAFLDAARLDPDAGVIDVGGGASTFVDDVVDRGYRNISVLDVSQAALDTARARLGPRAASVRWICADVTDAGLPENAYDFWQTGRSFTFSWVRRRGPDT